MTSCWSAAFCAGYSDNIPESIRRAVILHDQHCARPTGPGRQS